MNREINFRAWDGDVGILWGWEQVQKIHEWWKHRGLKLMQYTGLKDKNGKEIYEGDIVQCGETVGMGRKLLKQVVGEVQYLDNISGFGIEVQTGDNEVGDMTAYSWEIPHFTDFEIIGNIHQPELLKN